MPTTKPRMPQGFALKPMTVHAPFSQHIFGIGTVLSNPTGA
jgi:hypothetical protein